MPGKFFLASSIVCLFFIITSTELQTFHHPVKGDDASLRFLVLGDWGRKGEYNQSLVALQMGKIGHKLDIDFVISTGDNFYDDGLIGVHDSAFEESFTKIYTAESLQKPWYTVLGNHDYRGDVEAQLSSALREIDSRWICLRSFVVNAELADIFFVDTTPLITSYYTDYEHTYDWRGVASRESYTQNLVKDLESALSKSTAKWKLVVGHHAIRSIGYHGDTEELIEELLPILQFYNVDFYMNGHDHCLEHITDSDSQVQFFTSGAGSKAWRGDFREPNKQVKFFYDGQGFMSVQLTPIEAEIVFYDIDGKILHRWKKSQQLHQSM